jgi:hypothetical protein
MKIYAHICLNYSPTFIKFSNTSCKFEITYRYFTASTSAECYVHEGLDFTKNKENIMINENTLAVEEPSQITQISSELFSAPSVPPIKRKFGECFDEFQKISFLEDVSSSCLDIQWPDWLQKPKNQTFPTPEFLELKVIYFSLLFNYVNLRIET